MKTLILVLVLSIMTSCVRENCLFVEIVGTYWGESELCVTTENFPSGSSRQHQMRPKGKWLYYLNVDNTKAEFTWRITRRDQEISRESLVTYRFESKNTENNKSVYRFKSLVESDDPYLEIIHTDKKTVAVLIKDIDAMTTRKRYIEIQKE